MTQIQQSHTETRQHVRRFTMFLTLTIWFSMFSGLAWGNSANQKQLVENAKHTLESFMEDPNLTWFQEHVIDAKALLIIPQSLKGAFIFGAEGGSGVLIVRDSETHEWSHPAFYVLGGLSFGFQWGGQASEVIIMARTDGAVEKLYSSSFKLGGDASIAAGPYGGGVEGSTSANLRADFLSFSRSKGAFAGISFEGAVIYSSEDSNAAYYGKPARPIDIFVKKTVSNPHSDGLRQAAKNAVH
ncbi:lipid-binding SYLF domain-containing protein [Candidatus Nitronereus thalassa]|uniref:Lipid-binding SYLF domain-containing protein n=1 Tax=Candidatus Nitronereus thalassa TaxID=3020898 RepID=A0ABU3K450_9BACT|nr:lipid-binding SYLF domain-containing protein [Candidatus Nitronereus thalassa]MDT7041176.1 lipid-binding SYLF domain-containing protein [Candidatus Nitronereus thalassa]